MHWIHLIIESIYILTPLAVLARAIRLRYRHAHRRSMPLRRFRQTSLAGMTAGVLITMSFALSVHGRLMIWQVVLAGYFATSLILILQGLDRFCWHSCKTILRLNHPQAPSALYSLRAVAALGLRIAVVVCIGLPYVLATMMTYRPRAGSLDTPQSLYHWNYEPISFDATDGTHLTGWWIPAPRGESSMTVLLCPGTDMASQLSLVKRLRPAGYNVLAFDFRATGDSAGQLCSFGDLERRDVLGAVDWLRRAHPRAARKIAGIGAGTGGAALLAAAADPSPAGQNNDTIAVYGTYDRLDHEVDAMVNQFLPMPLSWLVEHVGLPLAGAQVGANLNAFTPADQIKAIWPRPVLVIHGMDDEYVPFEQGESLYDSALQPKDNFWIKECDHAGAIKSDAAARFVKYYFGIARRVI